MNKTQIKEILDEILPDAVDEAMEGFEVTVAKEDIEGVASPMIDTFKGEVKDELVEMRTKNASILTAYKNINEAVNESKANSEKMLDLVETALAAAPTPAAKAKVARAVSSASGSGSTSRVTYALNTYGQPGRAPVGAGISLIGPQGATKTYESRLYGRTAGFSHPDGLVEVGCFEGLEALDLLGGVDPGFIGKGDAWKDGPISSAYRWVGTDTSSDIGKVVDKGDTVMLLIDEINRMPQRERSIFLNSMSPENIGGYDCYKLRTGRTVTGPKGVKEDEILYAPCHLITIVATGNVGLEFDVQEDDPAGRERWIEVCVSPDEATIESILKSKCDDRSWSHDVVVGLMGLYKKTLTMRSDNLLRGSATVRTLSRIVDLSPSPKPSDLRRTAVDVGELWVDINHDGLRISEQKDLLEGEIKKLWK